METQVIKIEAEPTREDANRVIAQRSATVRAYVQEKLAEYGMPHPVCDLRYGLWPLRAENPYRDVINAANYIHLALMDSWFFFFEAPGAGNAEGPQNRGCKMHGNPVAMGVMIGLDDIARIDGIVGCVDFVGADIIILVDDNGREHRIDRHNIQTVEILQRNNTNELARIEL